MIVGIVLIAIIILIFYLRKEGLTAAKDIKEGESVDAADKDGTSKDTVSVGKDSVGKDSVGKDSVGKDSVGKDSEKTTTVIILNDRYDDVRRTDPFYAMTDPYWATYNYRWGYGPRHVGPPRVNHRRIW